MPSQIWADKSHLCETGHARLSEISGENSDHPDEMAGTNKKAETAPTVPTLNEHRLAGRHSINPTHMELMMQSDTTSRPGGATTTLSPALGKALRTGAKGVDQLLVELADQFIADAMAIDPTITGGWMYRDLTLQGRNRDPHGAVQGFYLEREHAPLVRKAGA